METVFVTWSDRSHKHTKLGDCLTETWGEWAHTETGQGVQTFPVWGATKDWFQTWAFLSPTPTKAGNYLCWRGWMDSSVNPRTLWVFLGIDEGSRYRVAKMMKQGRHQTMNAEQNMDYLRDGWFQFFGVPSVLRLDPAGAFRSREIEKMCDDYDINLDLIPGEAHWQLGSCEQAVKGTKEVMTKLAEQDPARDPQDLLSVAVNTFREGPLTKRESSYTPKPPMGLTWWFLTQGKSVSMVFNWEKLPNRLCQNTKPAMQSRAKPKYNPRKELYVFGTCESLATDTKRDSEGNLAPSSSAWLVRGRRLIKCCPEQLRPASEREELLDFLGTTKKLSIFQGLQVPWVVMHWMTLAMKSRIWQLGKETMGWQRELRPLWDTVENVQLTQT